MLMRPIKGFEGLYSVTEDGQVYSHRRHNFLRLCQSNSKKQNNNSNYYFVNLTNGKYRERRYVARLVADAFLPNSENKPEINHKDGNHFNNKINNLVWSTHQENCYHSFYVLGNQNIRYDHGHPDNRGEKSSSAKLNTQQVLDIRISRTNGATCASLGKKYGVDAGHISRICSKKKWKHI